MLSRKIKKRLRKQEKLGIKKAGEKKELQEGRKKKQYVILCTLHQSRHKHMLRFAVVVVLVVMVSLFKQQKAAAGSKMTVFDP